MRKIKKLFSMWSWKRLARNFYYILKYDLEHHEQDIVYQIKDEVIEECSLELADYDKYVKKIQVLNSEQSIQMLKDYPKSFTRYGDGEIHIMQGKDQPFQNYDPVLAQRMKQILATRREDIYVGINQAYYVSPNEFAERNKRFYRINATGYRRFFAQFCNSEGIYLDAACFGAYFRYGDDFDYDAHYNRIKALFKDKKIAIISGEGVLEKLQHSVFDEAKEQMVIHGPRIHAFSVYDELLEKIEKEVPKDFLVCAVLGQTATVLAYDLTDRGYMCWDVGHIAKDYDAYMKKTEKSQKNMDAFWDPD